MPLLCLFVAMFALGAFLRLINMDGPQTLKWDEHHYVVTARRYLHHEYLYNDHPPLSKLVIMAFMRVFGDGPVAWRLPSLLTGFLNIGLVAAITHRAFGSVRAAWFAAAFTAIDGFFIVYSRTALLDGIMVSLALTAMLAVLSGRTIKSVIFAGVLVGAVTSYKLNGLVFVVSCAGVCILSPRLRRYTPLLLLSAAGVYYAQWVYMLVNVGRSGSFASVIDENLAMVKSNLSYTVVHPYSSKWYTWFIPTNPIFLRRDVDIDGSVRALLTLGNPLLWWAAIFAVIEVTSALLKPGIKRLWSVLISDTPSPATHDGLSQTAADTPSSAPALLSEVQLRGAFWLVACYLGPILFWVPSLRDAYIYHYMPSYAFALPLLGWIAHRSYRSRRLATLLALMSVFLVSVMYAPLWAELPLSASALAQRLPAVWR